MKEFYEKLNDHGVILTNKMIKQLEKYYNFLISENEKYNLTAITEKKEVYFKHFYDSIMIGSYIDVLGKKILDVGSGAGFPGIPLKIVYPDFKLVIVDSLGKRINFLTKLLEILDLKDVSLVNMRIEEYKEKESYDLVIARAVARLNQLLELCIPYVKVDGNFICLKGKDYLEEINESTNAFKKLEANLENVYSYTVLDRTTKLLKIKKIGKTNIKYPRIYSKIKSHPL